MEQNITADDIKYFKELIAKYEPYPLSVLDDLAFDDTRYDESRLGATYAKKMLLEFGISLTEDPAQK